jgi:hypothetical protein
MDATSITLSWKEQYNIYSVVEEVLKTNMKVVLCLNRSAVLSFWFWDDIEKLKSEITSVVNNESSVTVVTASNLYWTKSHPNVVCFASEYIFGLNEKEITDITSFISDEVKKQRILKKEEDERTKRIENRRRERAMWRKKLEEERSDDEN